MRWLAAFLALVLMAAVPIGQPPTWVNIKDFGATGDGSTDDWAAIQAANDYMFAHNMTGTYCPAGAYKISNTLWLDPANNMRATYWTGTGYISGTTFTVSSTTANSLAVGEWVSGSGVTPATIIVGGSNPTWTVNNSQTVGSSGSPVALSANNPSSPSQFAYSTTFFGDPAASGGYMGCRIKPTFNNAPAVMVGTGQGMRVAHC